MDDEMRLRFEKHNNAGRNVAIVAAAGIAFSALWEYLDPAKATNYMFVGFVAGVTVGFVLCLFTTPKR
jgi:hypothetical protein